MGLFQSKQLAAKQVGLQKQLGYRDILAYHRQAYIALSKFAPVQINRFYKLFLGIP